MASKKTDVTTPKTYNSLRGFLVAKAAGALPRGVKARIVPVDSTDFGVEFYTGKDREGDVLIHVSMREFIGAALARIGFKLDK